VDIRGTAELIEGPDKAFLRRIARKYTDEDPSVEPDTVRRLIVRAVPAKATGTSGRPRGPAARAAGDAARAVRSGVCRLGLSPFRGGDACRAAVRPGAGLLQLGGEPEEQALAALGGDELHAQRQVARGPVQRDRHR